MTSLRRIAAAFLVTVLSGTFIAIGLIAPGSANAAENTTACPAAKIFGVRGSDEKQSDAFGFGSTVYDVVVRYAGLQGIKRSDQAAISRIAEPIDYQAIRVLTVDPRLLTGRYTASVRDGTTKLTKRLHEFIRSDACGKVSQIFLVGFSQGAQVVGDTWEGIGLGDTVPLTREERDRITRVVLLADPKFNGLQGKPVAVGDYRSSLNGIQAAAPGATTRTRLLDSVPWRSYCDGQDAVCQFDGKFVRLPLQISPIAIPGPNARKLAGCISWVPGGRCPHYMYAQRGYTAQAAAYLNSRTTVRPNVTVTPASGPTGTVVTVASTSPCPSGTTRVRVDIVDFDSVASPVLQANRMWTARVQTVSKEMTDPATGVTVYSPLTQTLQAFCFGVDGSVLQQYTDATFTGSRGIGLRLAADAPTASAVRVTVSPAHPCPTPATKVVVFAGTHSAARAMGSPTSQATTSLGAGGSWQPTVLTVPYYGPDTKINVGAQCQTDASQTTTYYDSTSLTPGA